MGSFSFPGLRRVPEMGAGDGRTTTWMTSVLLNCSLRHDEGGEVYVVIICAFYHTKSPGKNPGLKLISKNEPQSRLSPSTLETDYGCLASTPRPSQQQG